MLRGELPTDTEVEAFNKALVLHDHELNALHLLHVVPFLLYLICTQVL